MKLDYYRNRVMLILRDGFHFMKKYLFYISFSNDCTYYLIQRFKQPKIVLIRLRVSHLCLERVYLKNYILCYILHLFFLNDGKILNYQSMKNEMLANGFSSRCTMLSASYEKNSPGIFRIQARNRVDCRSIMKKVLICGECMEML